LEVHAHASSSDPLAELYSMLEVEPTATTDELRQAFRRLTLQWHPDVSNATNAEEKFESIKVAYETLRNAEKRTKYINERRRQSGEEGEQQGTAATDIVQVTSPGKTGAAEKKEEEEEPKSATTTTIDDDAFYGFSDLFRDTVKDRLKANRTKPMSVWEELGAIGGEFMSGFLDVLEEDARQLERETLSADDVIRNTEAKAKLEEKYRRQAEEASRRAAEATAAAAKAKEEAEQRARQEIDDMLEDLKRKLGKGDAK